MGWTEKPSSKCLAFWSNAKKMHFLEQLPGLSYNSEFITGSHLSV